MPHRKAVALTFMTSDIPPDKVEQLLAFFKTRASCALTLPLKDGTEAQMLIHPHAEGSGDLVSALSRMLGDPAHGWVVALCAGAPAELQEVPQPVPVSACAS